MASVIVVDDSLSESVREYGQIVESMGGLEEKVNFQKFFTPGTEELVDAVGLQQQIYATAVSENLKKLSDKEFEPAFNLILYILTKVGGSLESIIDQDSPVIRTLVDCTPVKEPSLRDRRSIKPTTILSVLNSIFNFLPETSPKRIIVLQTILEVVQKANVPFSLIQKPIGGNLVLWLQKANASEAELKAIFWKLISLDSKKTLESLQAIKAFTSQYSLSLDELHQLITFAFLSETVDVSFLVNYNVANAMKQNVNDELVAAFNKFTRGELITEVPSSLANASGSIIEKSRILTLARYLVENEVNGVYKYSDIPTALAADSQEFELLLINAIKAGVIEGKLNQVDETFHLTRVNRYILAGDDEKISRNWAEVKRVLIDWKNSLANIDDIVKASRENIVNNNSN